MNENLLYTGLARYFSAAQLERLRAAHVGVAGAGGLGSNAALMLTRCGVGHLLLVDDDVVDASNLNRQQYWPRHVGQPKVRALAEILCALNPDLDVDARVLRLTRSNMTETLACCPCWVEAMDSSEDKSLFVESALLAGCRVASASGMAGCGGPVMGRRRLGRLVQVGDFVTDVSTAPPLAPRVTQAAGLLADAVLEMLLGPSPWC